MICLIIRIDYSLHEPNLSSTKATLLPGGGAPLECRSRVWILCIGVAAALLGGLSLLATLEDRAVVVSLTGHP